MMATIEFGRLLRAGTSGCVVGCRVVEPIEVAFGGMVRIPLDRGQRAQVYGLIYDIHIDDDGLVRQLVTANDVSEDIIQDNRLNRNVPLEISVLFVGYREEEKIFHLLPPRPPLTLDAIYHCDDEEIAKFCSTGRFGYFRHILRASDLPVGELLAAHLKQAAPALQKHSNAAWVTTATQELITLLRDDYPTLMGVLGALSDAQLNY